MITEFSEDATYFILTAQVFLHLFKKYPVYMYLGLLCIIEMFLRFVGTLLFIFNQFLKMLRPTSRQQLFFF